MSSFDDYYLPYDVENEPPTRKLVRLILDRISEQRLAMRMDVGGNDDVLYAPHFVAAAAGNGGAAATKFFTRSYKPVATVESFVREFATVANCSKKQQQEEAEYLPHHCLAAVGFITAATRHQISLIHRDRHWLAFRDGMYITRSDSFYHWNSVAEMRELDRLCSSALLVGGTRCAAKYHDHDFKHSTMEELLAAGAASGLDWYHSLPTPMFQRLLDYQGIGEEAARWVYIHFGRMLFELGQFDNWQVQLAVTGAPETGRAALMQHFMRIFEKKDIVIVEEKNKKGGGRPYFPTQALQKCFAWFVLDIKENFPLDITSWLSMVSGEKVCENAMCGSPGIRVTSPGMLAGNCFRTTSASVSRRVMNIEFTRTAELGGGNDAMEKGELHVFVKKINAAYRAACSESGGEYIWNVAPKCFRRTPLEK